ncbi:MAG: xanthine dehydrogenase family protein subunit M [Planctomycetes bacterium]|nr:xanthine dehydrogenase family protein subunit M [Planctomycetota bacterium]
MRAYLPAYHAEVPGSLRAALETMAREPGVWTPLAGGTDIMVLLAAGRLPPGKYLSIRGLPELSGIREEQGAVVLGALTTYREVRRSAMLGRRYPMLCLAAAASGAAAIQNRGTLGGNIVNGSPAADTPPALLCYDAELELISMATVRRVPYDGFHTGYKTMDLRPGELVRSVRLPARAEGAGALHYYRKVGTRSAQAISKVVFAALGSMEGGRVRACRIALGSVAPTVLRCRRTEGVVTGLPLDPARRREAAAVLRTEIAPIDDIRSTRAYRERVARNLLDDFLARLAATGGPGD